MPLPHVDASLRELERGLDDLEMIGVNIHYSILKRPIVEPEFLLCRTSRVQPRGASARRMRMELSNRLHRSRTDRMVAGVAGGLAHYFDVDPTIVRLIWVLALFATGPAAAVLYVVLALIMPREPETTIV